MTERKVWPAAVVLSMCAAVACGSTTPTFPADGTATHVTPSPSSTAVFCASMRQLGSDVHALLTLDVVAVGVGGLKTAVQRVSAQLGVVARDASGAFGPQLRTLRAELDDLGDTIAGLTDAAGVRTALSELRSQIAAVGSGWDALKRQAADVCP
ncbi:hypothetical protein [Kutzneria buriramensis]|uniref:Uncharacterized protein n=1 Tax=Kutzneria buriramensis TaxID=1045776 RepID=A0A3E0GYZ6_9PSEU|nr:hypothetical protein [Kutzneria buriramensis]REH34886.1 hypothetical protein BCF44_119162 [Kutzneria buriramensis]